MKKFFSSWLRALSFAWVAFNLGVGLVCAQTNPAAQPLPFTLSAQSGSALPAGVAVHRFGTTAATIPITRTLAPGTGDLPYSATSNAGGWRDEAGGAGIGILSSGAQAAGALVVAIDTTGKSGIQVSWICRTILQQASRDNSVALQYRVGTSGNFADVGATSTYTSQGKTVPDVSPVFTETLPAAADNQPVVQVRWIYWESNASSGSRDRIAIDDIAIAANGTVGPTAPEVASTTPANAATNIGVSAPLSVTFNQAVNVTGSWFNLTGATTGSHTATVSGGPTSFTLTPDVPFAGGEIVTLTLLAAQIVDQASGTLHLASDYVASYTTLSSVPLAIHTVQGSGATSPYATQIVTVQGVVTASFQGAGKIGGYYIEAPDAQQDADPATSEGIYIFDNANSVTIGDFVSVTGTVTEFGAAPNSETEISPVSSFTKMSTGNPLPTAVTVNLPFSAAGFAERYEGMRVTLPQTLTVTDNFDYGHFGELVLSNGRLSTPTNIVAPGAPAQAQAAANLLNQILLDDGLSTTYPDPTPFLSSADPATATRRAGSTTTGLTGILDHKFGTYVIEPTAPPVFVDANPRTLPPNPGGTLHVAIGNVLNFFNGNGAGGGFPTSRGADTFAEYQRQRAKIVAGILAIAPDIMGLTEVENDGFGAASAIQDIVNGLNASAPAGTTYAFVNPGLPSIGTDLITCGFIYKTNTVALVGAAAVNLDGVFNRPPIAQTFRQISTGEKLTITINHFKSKGSAPASGPDADQGDGQSAWNVLRTSQANALTAWLATHPTGDADPDVLIIGDLNSYAKEDPITAIKSAGFTNLTEAFEGAGGYSYAFNAEFGHLDHALGTATLVTQTAGAESWHVNADEPVYYDYNVENKNVAQQAINVGTPYRYSDHDPVVIGLNLASGPPTLSYSAWTSANGLVAGQDAPTQDPEADGIVNLLEYFLGLRPTVSDPAGLPTGSVEAGDFVFRFNRNKLVTGVSYEVLTSTDLVTWTSAPAAVKESETTDLETFVVELPLTSPRLFAKLEVTLGATTLATVPVGYMNVAIAGGTPGAPTITPVGIPLDRTSVPPTGIRAGRIESFTANTVTQSGGGWTANLAGPMSPWMLKITSGPAAGRTLDIVANSATTLTLSGADLTTLGLAAGADTFELVRMETLSSLFGSAALQGGTSASVADNVQIRSGTTWLAYYFDTNLGFWRRTIGPATNSNNVLIRPQSGVQIVRRAAAVSLTFTGRVAATPFHATVNNASSTVIHRGFPTDTTLGTLALQTRLPGWKGGDLVSLHNGTTWIAYSFNGSFWQPAAGPVTNTDTTAIPAGALITIQRTGATSGTTDLTLELPYSL